MGEEKMIKKNDSQPVRKRIFILEREDFPQMAKHGILNSGAENLDVDCSNSPVEYRRHLPLGYDLYLVHLSYTEEEVIDELKRDRQWCKIFVRPTTDKEGNLIEVPTSLTKIVNGTYEMNKVGWYKNLLESIGVRKGVQK